LKSELSLLHSRKNTVETSGMRITVWITNVCDEN
jgi:hypothetical protein